MKVIYLAAVLVAVIAVGANFVLESMDFSSQDENSSPSVRLDASSK